MAELPEGAIETHTLNIVSYITPEGGNAYAVSTTGNAPMTSYLGLLIVAQQEILKWGDDE